MISVTNFDRTAGFPRKCCTMISSSLFCKTSSKSWKPDSVRFVAPASCLFSLAAFIASSVLRDFAFEAVLMFAKPRFGAIPTTSLLSRSARRAPTTRFAMRRRDSCR